MKLLTSKIKTSLHLIGLIIVSACSFGHAYASAPLPFKADYSANINGLPIHASRTLSKNKADEYVLVFEASSFIGTITEKSTFSLSDQQIIPLKYTYQRRGLGSDRDAILKFNWDKNIVINDVQNKPWKMKIPDGTLDKLNYQLQLSQHLSSQHATSQQALPRYQVADGGKLKVYDFKVMGEEVIETQTGLMNTIKVERVRSDVKDKKTTIWFAKDWNYLIVRIDQEDDGKKFQLFFEEGLVNNKKVIGLKQ